MCFIAAIRRPLRSKRARISPVRPRPNASGFTRIRVRSISRRTGGGRGGRAPRPRAAALGRLADLGLAVGADLPARVERLPAHSAGLLEPPQAARAAEEGPLDVEAAVRAGELVGL